MALRGLMVVEFAGLAPAPFAGLVLSHHGASVVRIDKPSMPSTDVLCAGKRSIALDLKNPSGIAVARRLIARSDVVIDSFRPGTMERMGLGPDLFYDNDGKKGLNDRLIYARIAGFPPDSPYKFMAGHELSYLATSGVLSMLPGSPEKPAGAILADFAGGGLMCATGILLAVVERTKSGRGQVVDVNLVAGTRYVSSYPLLHHVASTSSILGGPRGTNLYDGGAPFYDIYTCSDGQWISVACLEPEFFAIFIERFNTALQASGVKSEWIPTHKTQSRKKDWPKLRGYLEDGFRRMPRDFWASIFHGSDACAMPVLTPEEASQVGPSGSLCPAPHPHLSRTPPLPQEGVQLGSTLEPGTHTMQVLIEVGLSRDEIEKLTLDGAFGNDSYITISRSKL